MYLQNCLVAGPVSYQPYDSVSSDILAMGLDVDNMHTSAYTHHEDTALLDLQSNWCMIRAVIAGCPAAHLTAV